MLVKHLCPASAAPLRESTSVAHAAAVMAAKQQDAILVMGLSGDVTGILTDRDIAFKITAKHLDPSLVPIHDIMTFNPVSVSMADSAMDALNKMMAGEFRHLAVLEPSEIDERNRSTVVNDSQSISDLELGILDITKCIRESLERIEVAFVSKYQMAAGIDSRVVSHEPQRPFGVSHKEGDHNQPGIFNDTQENAGPNIPTNLPSLKGLLQEGLLNATIVHCKTTVLAAAKLMAEEQRTAVLVYSFIDTADVIASNAEGHLMTDDTAEPPSLRRNSDFIIDDAEEPLSLKNNSEIFNSDIYHPTLNSIVDNANINCPTSSNQKPGNTNAYSPNTCKLSGIFTTKDLVLRMVAAGLDPNIVTIDECMTPHPDHVSPQISIISCLKLMHGTFILIKKTNTFICLLSMKRGRLWEWPIF